MRYRKQKKPVRGANKKILIELPSISNYTAAVIRVFSYGKYSQRRFVADYYTQPTVRLCKTWARSEGFNLLIKKGTFKKALVTAIQFKDEKEHLMFTLKWMGV